MSEFVRFLDRFSAYQSGATLVEYTVLLGLITIVSLALIIAVGGWVVNGWAALNNTLASNVPAT